MRTGLGMVITLVLVSATSADEVAHPRLFLNGETVAKLRKAVAVDGSHHQRAFAALKARVDEHLAGEEVYGGSKYAPSYFAREAALAAHLGPSADQRQKYADAAFETIRDVYEKNHRVSPVKGSGLAKGMMSLGVGLAYDWCYPLWSDDQRSYVRRKIDEAMKRWPSAGHSNLSGQKVSNWVAVMRGGEMMMRLAAGESVESKRYEKLRYDLTIHMHNAFGSLGVSQEGSGYTEYPGGFLLPAAYAAAECGDGGLLGLARNKRFWKLAMYSHSFQEHRTRKFLQTGVAHRSNFDEGWTSLLLNLPPGEQMPYYLWFYDRHMGVRAPGDDSIRFDHHRAGTVWSILFYPTDVQPKDPTGVYPKAVGDDRGYFFFRNRWKDANDIQFSLMADEVHHGKAWDQPEVFAINLLAGDTRFIGGPGKKRDAEVYSTLLVDGKYNVRHATRLNGKTVTFDTTDDGGYVIVDGAALYKALGCDSARRHGLVHFSSPEDNTALIATLDRLEAGESRTFTWQANLGSESPDEDHGVELSKGTESGRPTFLMAGRGDAYVKGWVLNPLGVEIDAVGDPLRISAGGEDVDLWVVMHFGRGAPPTAQINGQGLDTRLTIGGRTIEFDPKTGRMLAQ